MAAVEIDLLGIQRGLVVAPAGCGKTQLIADALKRHTGPKPVLILTHTNAGVFALRTRLNKAAVKPSAYRLSTIDGWAMRLIATFPERSGHDPTILTSARPDYPAIRKAAANLLKSGHINDVIVASYERLLVDEYQDCSRPQHVLVCHASTLLPVCVLGDDMQAIFQINGEQLPDWKLEVCGHFPFAGMLTTPWRWENAGARLFGDWLMKVRQFLHDGTPVDLRTHPDRVIWIELDGSKADYQKRLGACATAAPDDDACVLIIADSANPKSHQLFARHTRGALTVEAVELGDLVDFSTTLNLNAPDALKQIALFAGRLMTGVNPNHLLQRTATIMREAHQREPSETESAAIAFLNQRTHRCVADLLLKMNREAGVRRFRPAVLGACLRALDMCGGSDGMGFREAALHIREQNRFMGRRLPRRGVGSTLLLKGLEADVAVILNADQLDAHNLYVAMTRGSRKLVICSKSPVLNPSQ